MGRQRRPWRRRAPLMLAAAGVAAAAAAGAALHRADRATGTVVGESAAKTVSASAGAAEHVSFADAFAAGIAHLRQGDAHAAARAFEAARRINPHAAEVYVNLGYAYLELGRSQEAAMLLNRATELRPDLINAYFGLAEALDAIGDRPGAAGAMRVYLHRAAPDDPFRRRAMAALWEWEQAAGPTRNAAARAEGDAPPTPPDTAPAGLRLTTLDGAPADLEAHRGKTRIVNVWASWCGPCRAELPSLGRLAGTLDPDAYAVIGLSVDRERAFTREFLRETGVAFPNYWAGEDGLDGGPFEARALPLTLIIDAEGRTVARHEGARDWAAPALVAALEALTPTASPQAVAQIMEALE